MGVIHVLKDVYAQFKEVADFVTVYIAEAHATDEWPISYPTCTQAHKTLEDRIKAAATFVSTYDWPLPVVPDRMDDDIQRTLGAWPFRMYIVQRGRIVFQGQPEDYTYPVSHLASKLTELTGVAMT